MTTMIEATKPKSDQLNADDLIGRTLTIKVSEVRIKSGEQPISVHYEGDGGKPYKPCKSMARMMIHIWGEDAKQYIAKSMTLYCDPKVTFGPMQMGGIRISHMSHLDEPKTVMLTVTKASRKPFTVQPLTMAQDKATAGAEALIKRIEDIDDLAGLEALTADATVVKQRAFLKDKRPELAERVEAVIEGALAKLRAEPEIENDAQDPA